MFDAIDDTIVAVSSPPGAGVRGIVRCSGPAAIAVAVDVFTPDPPADIRALPGFRRLAGRVEIETNCSVPAEIYLFRAPRSYTRQDCVEFHVPGAPPLLAMLVERLVALDARPAGPGEFTARAFLNGAMDLTRAEAVGALIRSRSDAQLRAARRMMDGRLADQTERILEDLAELVALVEADIDFAEEPIDFLTPAELTARLDRIAARLDRLTANARSTERIDALPHILLVGRSNAGKSTLMNRLAGIDRSICSHLPGTTRDILSAPVSLGGGEAVLLDAAGVDPDDPDDPDVTRGAGPQRVGRDPESRRAIREAALQKVVREAATATMAAARRVDLLALVVDLSEDPDDGVFDLADAAPDTPCVVIGNKIDLLDRTADAARRAWLENAQRRPVCTLSAGTGAGLDACRRLLARALALPEAGIADDAVLITARQRDAVAAAADAVRRCAAEAVGLGATLDRADILAFELREALEALGSVAGSVTTEDLLGRVFASFCIGK